MLTLEESWSRQVSRCGDNFIILVDYKVRLQE